MNTPIQISRDTEGVRVEVLEGDLRNLRELGSFWYTEEGDTMTFFPTETGSSECSIHGGDNGLRGLRFHDRNRGREAGIKNRRFGPLEVEADIFDPKGFAVGLPPLHERPWPNIRENDGCYNVGEQMILSLAEPINSRIDCTGVSAKEAIQIEAGRIPPNLRRFLPRRRDTLDIVQDQMARLRLPFASA